MRLPWEVGEDDRSVFIRDRLGYIVWSSGPTAALLLRFVREKAQFIAEAANTFDSQTAALAEVRAERDKLREKQHSLADVFQGILGKIEAEDENIAHRPNLFDAWTLAYTALCSLYPAQMGRSIIRKPSWFTLTVIGRSGISIWFS